MSVVYPVPNHTLNCAPAAALETDAATARRLIRTGAFTATAPSGPKPEAQAYEADERLDFYDPPRGDHKQPEGAADAAPSDSAEG